MNSIKLAPLLLTFVEVAKQNSFTQAAKQLSLSKSAVSQQIKRLESELSLQLLARNTRGVVLTNAGKTLLSRSELLNEQLINVVSDLNKVREEPTGRFRISVPPFFERKIIVPALRQFCIEYPLLEPELIVTGKWQDLIEHQLDAAIFGGKLKDSNYKAMSIGKVYELFCATPNYLQQNFVPESLSDLSKLKYIASSWQKNELVLLQQNSKKELITAVEYGYVTNNLATLVEMSLADMGIALLPEFVCRQEIARGHLINVLPSYHGRPWHFYFLHRFQDNKPDYVARFYQLVKHYFTAETIC